MTADRYIFQSSLSTRLYIKLDKTCCCALLVFINRSFSKTVKRMRKQLSDGHGAVLLFLGSSNQFKEAVTVISRSELAKMVGKTPVVHLEELFLDGLQVLLGRRNIKTVLFKKMFKSNSSDGASEPLICYTSWMKLGPFYKESSSFTSLN